MKLSVSNSKAFSIQQQCIEDHFSALLHLKQGFNFSGEYSKTRLTSWNPGNRDCCSWEGITCHGATGHVTSLDLSELRIFGRIDFVSLFRLQSLQRLNFAYNNFDGSPIPSGFEHLTSLTHLNLSHLKFYGQIPLEISRLTTLVSLDLSYNSLQLKNPSIRAFVQNLSSLRELHLSWANISVQGSEWGLALSSALPLLQKLSLKGCHLSGPIHPSLSKLHFLSELYLRLNNLSSAIPKSIFSLPNLQTLDVSYNPLLTAGEIPPNNTIRQLYLSATGFCSNLQDSYGNFTLLTKLVLSSCYPGSPFPSSLGNLSNLIYLDLSSSGFSGLLPSSLGNLSNLAHLDLSSNGLSGPLPSSLANLSNLVHLDLSTNGFSGRIPSSLFSLPSLRVLHLQKNQFSGELGEFQNTSSSLLENIYLYENKLEGPIPRSIFQLTTVIELRLDSNSFNGTIPSLYGNALHNCTEINFSNNSLSGTIPSSLFSLPSLQEVHMEENQFSGQLDQFQYTSSSVLQIIVLSNNSLNGTIPSSLFSLPSLQLLYLQENQFSGQLGEFHNPSSSLINAIGLDNNKLEGPIPMSIFELTKLEYLSLSSNNFSGDVDLGLFQNLENLWLLDLSDNNFSVHDGRSNSTSIGEVPSLICNCTSLQVLNLSHNRFSGFIPPCLGQISDALIVLNLGGNAFHGPLLQTFKEECTLKTLDLNGNQLKGQVPSSLARCKKLEVLNLGNNQIHDTFPFWIENLSHLHILILTSNRFHGTIGHPQANHTFPLLQIFDLSYNGFTGNLPSNLFRSWNAMMETKSQSQVLSKTAGKRYYQDKVIITSKGLKMELVKILTAFTVVDLSNNQFHGDIPESVGNLKSLVVLNMSYNHFTSRIPASLGNIKALESLDLSHNNVSGEIPWQLTKLNFLAVLDLSENFLIGSIPQGPQFNTFTNKSFLGNSGLCGTPLSKKCEHVEASPPLAQSESKYDWKSMWIGFGVGYGVGMGILFWTLALWTKGMKEFTIFVDRVLVLIFPCEAFILMHPY
ncbi:receptor-like protein 11 [Magnolia sinica]|uniref:receptor-like protein 11 n=1 Tax=Magnolia sinica TaxID=86752 RepID=UPI00265B4902|nr:receptor-like protein 11 [Magnolia sinica]